MAGRRQRRARRSWIAALALLVLALVSACSSTADTGGSGGSADSVQLGWRRVPAVALPDLRSTTSSQLTDGSDQPARDPGPTLVNIWAGWCGPCVAELPLLRRLSAEREVQVVGVSRDVREVVARQALKRAGVHYVNWFDPDGAFVQKLRGVVPPSAVPSTLLVVDDQVVAVHIGPFHTTKDALDYRRYTRPTA